MKDNLSEQMWTALDAIWRHRWDPSLEVSAIALERRGLVERALWGWQLTASGSEVAAQTLGDQPTGHRLQVVS